MNIFALIKSKISILEVVNEYTILKKAGTYWRATCPFHSEKTPSFTVSPHKEIFYCFGCNIGGDVITFITKAEQCTSVQAARYLAERYHIDLPDMDLENSQETMEEKERYFHLCKQIALWCHEQLKTNTIAREYLIERTISKESIEYFTIGYMPSGLRSIQNFISAMTKHAIMPNDLLQAHILAQGKKVLYSPFEDRLIFPIRDHLGRFCGFGGRVFKPQDTRPKYYNSHENSFFIKNTLLFGFDLAKKAIQKTKQVILVEGYIDCITMVQNGFTNTVATLGTACSLEHLKQLTHHAQQAIVMYDGDQAGQQALLRLSKLCWQTNLDLKVAQIPSGDDPASLLAKNILIKPFVEDAQEFFNFFVTNMSAGFDKQPLGEKLQRARLITDLIADLNDPLKQDILLATASKALGLPLQALKGILPGTKNGAPSIAPLKQSNNPHRIENSINNPLILEKRIFSAILSDIELLDEDNSSYLTNFLSSPFREILRKLKDARQTTVHINFQEFFDLLNLEEKQLVSRISVEEPHILAKDTFKQLLGRLQHIQWRMIVKKTIQELQNVGPFTEEQQADKIIQNLELVKKQILTQEMRVKKKVSSS